MPRSSAAPLPLAAASPTAAGLPDFGVAPELTNDTWLNTDRRVRLADLRGKVVLIEFWTYGCINCQNVLPALADWHARFEGPDFALVSIHYPEFAHEREVANVEGALERLDVRYPVAIDNDGATWRAYNQYAWPTRYLVDRRGRLRYRHVGEGAYDETEAAIEALLAEPGS